MSPAIDPESNAVNNASPNARSLVISPNLDALLEFEERTRCQTIGFSEPQMPVLQQTVIPPNAESPIGLPPPPRRPQYLKSLRPPWEIKANPLLPEFVEAPGREHREEIPTPIAANPILPSISRSTSNPYINPAPTLDEVLHVAVPLKLSVSVQPGVSVVSVDRVEEPRDHPQPEDSQLEIDARPTQRDDGQEPLAEQAVSALPRSRGKPSKQISDGLPGKKSASIMFQASRPDKEPLKDGGHPLISHGHHSSISSCSSVRSASTDGENGPRISISSTIYPASSTESHSHSLYNKPIPHRDSALELYSRPNPEFNGGASSGTGPPSGSPISEIPNLCADSGSSKPPIPKFVRASTRTRQPPSTPPPMQSNLPPTSNFLDIDERADLVRKSRKLARVFGQAPGADAMAQQDSSRSTNATFLQARSQTVLNESHPPWRPEPSGVVGLRRYSLPLIPDDVPFLSVFDDFLFPSKSKLRNEMDAQEERTLSSDLADPHHAPNSQIRSSPPTSFIDLSDDGAGAIEASSTFSRSPSHLETMFLEETVDADRKRKRERLAKLHRFLGSRVPANIVLGIDDTEASLPPPPHEPASLQALTESDDTNTRKTWLKRRGSGPAALASSARNEDLERVKEELDDREKAINVRRAQKMEKVFGVAPPQTLYHTRQSPILPLPSGKVVILGSGPDDKPQPEQRSLNINKSAYMKPKTKKSNRPGTSESSKHLLPKGPSLSFDEPTASSDNRHSLIYNHYQHSLISLNLILDRDDRESLAELHQYLNNNTDMPNPQHQVEPPSPTYRRISFSSIKSERRHSLPSSTSMVSLSSEYTTNTSNAEITAFQLRRRRAAKLAQFFGVNYRELITDVLDSIENGVQQEERKGTLLAEEVEDLLSKLKSLKTKRQSLF